jgi:type II secretory pathway pseudopilin PulG
MRLARRQRGFSFLLLGVVLVAGVLAVGATRMLSQVVTRQSRAVEAQAVFAAAHEALAAFVAYSGRLPCPANPAADSGDADRNVDTATCNFSTGTLPWRTLGMRRTDSFDPWGGKISYRVYTGGAGSLAQDSGASMTNCDTSAATPTAVTTVSGSLGGLCQPTHDTPDTAYLAGKGLQVTDFGSAVTDAAYVLVSHGPSGYGGYQSSGAAKPTPGGTDEVSNTLQTGPFVAKAASGPGVSPEDSTHFDDLLGYVRIAELARRSGASARDWP